MLKEAFLYEKLDGNKISCVLCSHRCLIGEGKFGICHVRENQGGVLYTHAYGELIAQHLELIGRCSPYRSQIGRVGL